MSTLRFILPFSYFFKSRLQKPRDIIFHFYYEWLIGFLLLCYFLNYDIVNAFQGYISCYIAFIAIYEIGYLGNDVYSVRNEADPRLRIKNFNPTNFQLGLWIILRVVIFASISWHLNVYADIRWLALYFCLLVFFLLHNIIRQKELKTFTFINLAFIRFVAPFFVFLTSSQQALIIPTVLLNYVFYRTLTYMDSKKLLIMPSRTTSAFKLNYYLLMGGINIVLSFIFKSPLPIVINVYYFVFWLLFFLKEKVSINSKTK